MHLNKGGALVALTSAGLVGFAACSLDSAGPSQPNPNCNQFVSFAVGDTVRDAVTTSSCRESDGSYENLYEFTLSSATKVRLSLSSPLHVALVEVGDSTGGLVANSTTGPLDTTATVRMILKPGLYKVGVNSAATTPSGTFRMVVAADNSPVTGCGLIWVTTGVTTTQTITTADCTGGPLGSKYYYHGYITLFPVSGELKLSEHSTAFVPAVFVVSATSGSVLTLSSIDSTNTTAVVDYLPSATDFLEILVGSSDSLQVGQYTLTIP